MRTTPIQRLAAVDLFADCRRSDLTRIDQLGCTLTLPGGRTLCTEGAEGNEFFVLVDGCAEVRTQQGTVALLHPGAWFGETALLGGGTRRATVTTLTEVIVVVFGKREFRALLDVEPNIRARLQGTTARVVDGEAPTQLPWYQPLNAFRGHAGFTYTHPTVR